MSEAVVKAVRYYFSRTSGLLASAAIGTRLAIALLVSILAIVLGPIELLALLSFSAMMLFMLARPSPRKAATVIGLTALVVWSIVLSQALFYQGSPRTPIAVLVPESFPIIGWLTGGIYAYYEGIVYGLKQSLRAVACLLTGAALASTTSTIDVFTLLAGHPKLLALLLAGLRGVERVLVELEDALSMLKLSGERIGIAKFYSLAVLLAMRAKEMSQTIALMIEYSRPQKASKPITPATIAILAIAIAVALAFVLYKLVETGIMPPTPQLLAFYEAARPWMS